MSILSSVVMSVASSSDSSVRQWISADTSVRQWVSSDTSVRQSSDTSVRQSSDASVRQLVSSDTSVRHWYLLVSSIENLLNLPNFPTLVGLQHDFLLTKHKEL